MIEIILHFSPSVFFPPCLRASYLTRFLELGMHKRESSAWIWNEVQSASRIPCGACHRWTGAPVLWGRSFLLNRRVLLLTCSFLMLPDFTGGLLHSPGSCPVPPPRSTVTFKVVSSLAAVSAASCFCPFSPVKARNDWTCGAGQEGP